MLRGELHNRGSAGRCEACGEIFPCATALAILAAVKNDVEQLTSSQRVANWHTTWLCADELPT